MKKLIFSSTLSLFVLLLVSVSAVYATVALTTAGGALSTASPTAVVTFTSTDQAPLYFGVCDPADSGAEFELFFDTHAYANNAAGDQETIQLGTAGVGAAGTYTATIALTNGDVVPSGTFFTALGSDRGAVETSLMSSCGADLVGFVPEPPNGSIRGNVFLDSNRNGVQDVTEPAVSNVFVTVYSSGEWFYEFYTGSDGTYAPVALNESYYALEITVPTGYVATTPTRIEGIYIGGNGQSLSLNNDFGIDVATAEDTAAQQAAADAAAAAAASTAATTTTTQVAYGGGTYTVRAGDTLFRIALNHGVELNALRAANGIYTNTIYPGQQLIIPGATGGTYVAEAQPAETTVAAAPTVVDVNGSPAGTTAAEAGSSAPAAVTADAPQAPAAVTVVDASQAAPAAVTADAPQAPAASGGTYMVKPGENLFRIALNHGVPLDELAAANNIVNPTMIHVGQELVIPGQ